MDCTDSSPLTVHGLLVARAQAGDRQAYGELVSRYGALVHGLCRGMCGSPWDAQDLAHDAFVEAWLKLPSLRDPERFAPWLRTIAGNLCRGWHRQRRREREGMAQAWAEESPAAAGDEDTLNRLSIGLARLSSDHRLVLALQYRQQLAYEEIAAFLEVPIGTVMSRLHRARENLKQRMTEMSEADEQTPTGHDAFRQAVDAEIQVLLRVWEQEARQSELDSRYRSPTCQRLSVLLSSSPDLVRSVLETMDGILTEHVAIRVRRAGPVAIGVAVGCAYADTIGLRQSARAVLRRVLATAPDQPHNDAYFHLPPRPAASFVLDSVIRSAQTDAEKVALLVELLPGCEDHSTVILVGCALLCFADEAFPRLWRQWWTQEWSADAPPTATLAVLSRFGSRFLAALAAALPDSDPTRLRQILAGAEEAARRIGFPVFARTPFPDPALEWRTSGSLRVEEIEPHPRRALCQRLATLVADDRQAIRDAAVSILGYLGGPEYGVVLRRCLQHEALSTRVTAIFALKEMGDADSSVELLRIARHDEPAARRAALPALARLGTAEARELFVELTTDPQVGAQAISALGEIGGEGQAELERLIRSDDKRAARLAAGALYGGRGTPRPASDTTKERLRRVRGEGARPLLHVSVVGAIRNLPAVRAYREPELTRLIGEVCGDFATTRRELVMDGLMVREAGVYELTESGQALWRVERFLRERCLDAAAHPRPVIFSAPGGTT